MTAADEIQPAFGQRLRARRLQLGMTQDALAAAARLSRSQVANLEAGRRGDPSLGLYRRLCAALDVDPGPWFRPPKCTSCGDAPPAGFACLACDTRTEP